jgi:hypothetical protein
MSNEKNPRIRAKSIKPNLAKGFIIEESDNPGKPILNVADGCDILTHEVSQPVTLPDGVEPLCPGVPPQKGVRRFISPELWTLLRACAEGRRLSMTTLADLTGISITHIETKAKRDVWLTPKKIQMENNRVIKSVMEGIFDSVTANVVGKNGTEPGEEAELGEGDPDRPVDTEVVNGCSLVNAKHAGSNLSAADGDDEPGDGLRRYLETPRKERPRSTDLLPKTRGGSDRLAQLQAIVKQGLPKYLKESAGIHQVTVEEISRHAFVYFSEAAKQDPSLAILFAKELKALSEMARKNLRLDEDANDKLIKAKILSVMSDPDFIPKPANMTPGDEQLEDTPYGHDET